MEADSKDRIFSVLSSLKVQGIDANVGKNQCTGYCSGGGLRRGWQAGLSGGKGATVFDSLLGDRLALFLGLFGV